MPRFKGINFRQNVDLKLSYFRQESNKIFERWRRCSPISSLRLIGDVPQIPETPPYCTFLAARLNLIMFLHF